MLHRCRIQFAGCRLNWDLNSEHCKFLIWFYCHLRMTYRTTTMQSMKWIQLDNCLDCRIQYSINRWTWRHHNMRRRFASSYALQHYMFDCKTTMHPIQWIQQGLKYFGTIKNWLKTVTYKLLDCRIQMFLNHCCWYQYNRHHMFEISFVPHHHRFDCMMTTHPKPKIRVDL